MFFSLKNIFDLVPVDILHCVSFDIVIVPRYWYAVAEVMNRWGQVNPAVAYVLLFIICMLGRLIHSFEV